MCLGLADLDEALTRSPSPASDGSTCSALHPGAPLGSVPHTSEAQVNIFLHGQLANMWASGLACLLELTPHH